MRITPLRQIEKRFILRALRLCEDDKPKAATALGISLKTLYNKLNSYGIFKPRERAASIVGMRVVYVGPRLQLDATAAEETVWAGVCTEYRRRTAKRSATAYVKFDNGRSGWVKAVNLKGEDDGN
jgi:hypothetical protein